MRDIGVVGRAMVLDVRMGGLHMQVDKQVRNAAGLQARVVGRVVVWMCTCPM